MSPRSISWVIFAAIACACHANVRAEGDIRWTVRLYELNTEYIEVSVDTRGLPANLYIDHVKFEVMFYSGENKLLASERYDFTDSLLSALSGPYVHRRYFSHSHVLARHVKGGKMTYTLQVPGLKFHHRPDDEKLRKKAWKTVPDLTIEDKGLGIKADNKELRTIGETPKAKAELQ